MDKLVLRVLFSLFNVIALVTGGVAAFGGSEGISQLAGVTFPLDLATLEGATFDNDLRFFGGTWMGIGFMLLYAVVKWESSVVLIRFAGLAIFIGGLGRMTPWVIGGIVPDSTLPPIVLEIVVMPLLVLWDSRIRAKQTG